MSVEKVLQNVPHFDEFPYQKWYARTPHHLTPINCACLPIFAIEAGVINGWEKYVKYENFIGMKSFGASGPYKDVYKHFKITAEDICEKIKQKVS